MPHTYMPIDYYVWDAMLEHYQTHVKAGQHHDHFVNDTE